MKYKIPARARRNAKKIGVTIKPSKYKGKKIDIYKNGKLIYSTGSANHPDFAELMEKGKKKLAIKKQKGYKSRFEKLRKKKFSKSWYNDQILWS